MRAVDDEALWRSRAGRVRYGRRRQEAAGTFCGLGPEDPLCAPLPWEDVDEEVDEDELSAPEPLVEELPEPEPLAAASEPSEEEVEEAVEAPEVAESVE